MSADYACKNYEFIGIIGFKKLHLVNVAMARLFDACSIKIRAFFGVRFERRKVDKKQTYTKTETCKLYSRVF